MTVAELRDWLRNWVSKATGLPCQIGDDRPMDGVSWPRAMR